MQRSLYFYTRVTGMRAVGRGTIPHRGRYIHLRGEGSKQALELNWYPKGSRFFTKYLRGEELDHLEFVVDDVMKAFSEIVKRGGRVAVPPS